MLASQKKCRKHYSFNEKLKIINIFKKEQHLRSDEDKTLLSSVPLRNVKRWVELENELLKSDKKRVKKTLHAGGKSSLPEEVNTRILAVVEELRSSLIPIGVTNLVNIVRSEFPEQFRDKSFECIRSRLRRLLEKNNFVRRRVTGHVRPNLQVDAQEYKQNYIIYFNNLLSDLELLNGVRKSDQTAIFYENVPKYTMEKCGEKNPRALTLGSMKNRMTAMCTICNNGDKLPLYCVFNARRYLENDRVGSNTVAYEIRNAKDFGYPQDVFFDTQAKGWFDGDIVESWYKKPHKENEKFNQMCEETENLQKEILPANCTSFLQPLDVGVNGPLKAKLSEMWTLWAVEEYKKAKEENRPMALVKPDRILVCNWLQQVWLSISKSTILNSFAKPGYCLTNVETQTMVNLFNGDEEIVGDAQNEEPFDEDELDRMLANF
ncbi:hypothetical protein O9G_005419 [Rozella allomycis CSF55]|uniref:DDE-1 domain-containing protein n=1 Tax=Rozella allomycis (strain CSF55) TaxID=988480 RepID=A0A075ARE6_ROZAC|nr:hypothetical protein O9G_005419 [Rozella allomycis CSF55]|eukprot:EPZ32818.1 hypothetical protein O9G_005419 [Rozella allomycis CSF55]